MEASTSKKIKIWSRALDNYIINYTVEKVEFTSRKKVGNKKILYTVIKGLVYVKDPKSLVDHVCTVRRLEVDKVIIRVGIDGGQGSLKVVKNVFNIEADIDCKVSKDTCVNKVLVLAFVKNVTENHANFQILIEKTKLNNIKFYLAADLKLLNIIVGLSGHGGKYSCLYWR